MKTIDDLKRRIHDLQLSDRNNRTAAETAQAKLSTSEGSWIQQRQNLDRSIADLTARCKALTEQNNVLHQHLENVSSQATRIRQAAVAAAADPGEGAAGDNTADNDGTEAKLSELRAVINYLRKEKEIVDMQLELGKQENARLKTQIGHVTRDLEDTRTTLSDVSPLLPQINPIVDTFGLTGTRARCLSGGYRRTARGASREDPATEPSAREQRDTPSGL